MWDALENLLARINPSAYLNHRRDVLDKKREAAKEQA